MFPREVKVPLGIPDKDSEAFKVLLEDLDFQESMGIVGDQVMWVQLETKDKLV